MHSGLPRHSLLSVPRNDIIISFSRFRAVSFALNSFNPSLTSTASM